MNLSDCGINNEVDASNTLESITVWGVVGITNRYWPTKIVAELAAREHFPSEDPDMRYARIFFRVFNHELFA